MADSRGIKESNVSTTLILPRELRAQIGVYAKTQGISMGAAMRMAVERMLKEQKEVETA